ncbi:hypothetical protein FJY63_06245 [Candidatus Sumerlaeota bacterium]|nr:hypothetical protein [Candidatus Sumerlaeota bacterium]
MTLSRHRLNRAGCLLALSAVWTTMPSFAAQTSATLTIGAGSGLPGTGGHAVPISLNNTVAIRGLQLNLRDIPDALNVTGCNATGRTVGWTAVAVDHGSYASVMVVSLSSGMIAPGSGPIAQVVFGVKATSSKGTAVELRPADVNVADQNNQPLSVNAVSGQFTIPFDAPILAAEPAYTSGTTNCISWSASASAAAYYLEWSQNSSFEPVAGTSGWTTATVHVATGLADGFLYYYRVKSRNGALVESVWSGIVSSRQDASPPTAPARPTDQGAYTSSTSVQFRWTAASDPGTAPSGVASYELWVGTTPGGSNVFKGNVGNVSAQVVAGANGQALYARVRAIDKAGNVGPWSGDSDGITIDSIRPRLTVLAATNQRTVVIAFDEPVANADWTANCSFAGDLYLLAVQEEASALYYLRTSDQTPNTSYTATMRNVRDRAGNILDPNPTVQSFRGGTVAGVRGWNYYR